MNFESEVLHQFVGDDGGGGGGGGGGGEHHVGPPNGIGNCWLGAHPQF